ncbi:hypothetical protein ACFRJ1_19695 [Streptomyces sp. NPDC056773]|uniref:hypothetical protein n=1 Tax=unclassified Streptomyces TaxID=2593676 RepID=UPI00367D0B73
MVVGSVGELMDLLRGGDGDGGHGLRVAALLRRSHPFDKELQVAGLLIGRPAEAIRPLLGERVARLVRLHGPGAPAPGRGTDPDAESLGHAAEAGRSAGLDAGVLEDWRPVLELVAAGAYGRTA